MMSLLLWITVLLTVVDYNLTVVLPRPKVSREN